MSHDNLLAGLDIGTSKVAVVIGEVNDKGEIEVVGWASTPCNGLKKGIIVDIDQTVRAIETTVRVAEKMADVHVSTVFVSISGDHIHSRNNNGVIAVGPSTTEITSAEIERVVEAAQAIAINPNSEIIHILAREFKVDDQGGIKDPIKMSGTRLEAAVHIVYGSKACIQNVITAVEKAGLRCADVVICSVASSEACLSEDDRNLGVTLVDIGAGTTDIAVFTREAIEYTAVLPVGGGHVTNDLAVGLNVTTSEAERLKLEHGVAFHEMAPRNGQVIVNMGDGQKATMAAKDLVEIISPRMEEIFVMVMKELERGNLLDSIPRGIVLTGGGSKLRGAKKLAERIFRLSETKALSIREASPTCLKGLVEKIGSPEFSTAAGLLLYGLKNSYVEEDDDDEPGVLSTIKRIIRSIYSAIFD